MATMIINKSDSMSKIQSKLNKAGTIKFTTGTYKITKQLIIPANTTIDLNNSILQRKGSIQSIFLNKVTTSNTGYKGAGNIVIHNGKFEGMGGYSYDNLITFFHSHDIKIYDCTFQDILCHGIELNSTKGVKIFNCKFLGYNIKDVENAYKENIQIDFASFACFVLSGSSRSSKCYDGTGCQDIEIYNNLFTKSNYRDYPYACVGGHTQLSGAIFKHRNIKIHNNEFYCKKNPDLKQACISLTSMENVEIYNNIFDCYRVSRVYSKTYSYTNGGVKVNPKDGDGICNYINIHDNKISGCSTSKEAFQQYNKSGNVNHSNISKKNNVFV